MPTQAMMRQIRFLDVARAFQILAAHPDKALDVALEVDEDTIRIMETNLHGVAARLNGDPLAEEIEALLTFRNASQRLQVVHERDVRQPDGKTRFNWEAVQRPGAALGDLNSAFLCDWGGLSLKIEKKGPANYEGSIDGKHFAQSKFKRNLREKMEKEAARRVAG